VNAIKRMKENEHAVSPIVATLVLIVVAVVGAVAVGTIMGTFSGDVSDQMNTGDVQDTMRSSEVIVAGSTTVKPVSELLANTFMKNNPTVKVTVMGGGSGAGFASANMGTTDIGAASEALNIDKYPDLEYAEIGSSAVVVIANGNILAADKIVTNTSLYTFYTAGGTLQSTNSTTIGTIPVERSDDSGTEHTFAEALSKWQTGSKDKALLDKFAATNEVGKPSNQDVLNYVKSTSNAVGFVDYGIAKDLDGKGITILTIEKSATSYVPSSTAIKATLKAKQDVTNGYAWDLCRPLIYVWKKDSLSTDAQKFLDYARTPDAKSAFDAVGYLCHYDYAY